MKDTEILAELASASFSDRCGVSKRLSARHQPYCQTTPRHKPTKKHSITKSRATRRLAAQQSNSWVAAPCLMWQTQHSQYQSKGAETSRTESQQIEATPDSFDGEAEMPMAHGITRGSPCTRSSPAHRYIQVLRAEVSRTQAGRWLCRNSSHVSATRHLPWKKAIFLGRDGRPTDCRGRKGVNATLMY